MTPGPRSRRLKDNGSLLHPGNKRWRPSQGGADPFTLGDLLQVAGVA